MSDGPPARASARSGQSPVLNERARAKINLTLAIHGRRPDGYHELSSLVAFAGAADTITLIPDLPDGVEVRGPFAAHIAGRNILEATLDLLADPALGLARGHVVLEKNLPVAAGLGAGSANAAALLRAVRTLNPERASRIDWAALACRLGADVPVCLHDQSCWMSGTGEHLHQLPRELPPLDAVLVNPMVPVPHDKTRQVFRLLDAPARAPGPAGLQRAVPDLAGRTDLIELMRQTGNDLANPAVALVPEIAAVMLDLEGAPGVELVQLSGAGPTCFAILPGRAAAERTARDISLRNPHWWTVATTLS